MELLNIKELLVAFSMYKKGFRKYELEVIHQLSLNVNSGEIVAVVGSSGSGKSILAEAVLGLLPKNSHMHGEITYKGQKVDKKSIRKYMGTDIAYIPQSIDHLDPIMKVGKQVMGVHGSKERQKKLFKQYGLPEDTEKKYPFQCSGGMARRVLVTSALMGKPDLIIADEPTPGLDLKMALEALKDFRELADAGTGILLITHDIDLALGVADRIAVFYAGSVLEVAPVEDFVKHKDRLRHPYSQALINALPQNNFEPIRGTQPYAGDLFSGCLFAPRCHMRDDKCACDVPMMDVRGGKVRCVHAADG